MFGTDLNATTTPRDPNEIKNQKILDKQAFDDSIKTTFGYFIYQDSSYGNTLLPVIPRISSPDEETEETPNLKTEHVAKSSEEKPLVIELD